MGGPARNGEEIVGGGGGGAYECRAGGTCMSHGVGDIGLGEK